MNLISESSFRSVVLNPTNEPLHLDPFEGVVLVGTKPDADAERRI